MNKLMRAATIVLVCLFLCSSMVGQESSTPDSWIIRGQFNGGDGNHFIQEVGLIYGDYKDEPGTLAAIRVCSENPFPQALFTSALNPIAMRQFLAEVYSYSADRVYFLRSDDCLGPKGLPDAIEPWIIRKSAKMPSAVESIKSCQVDFKLLPSGESHLSSDIGFTDDINSLSGYRAAVGKLVKELKARPSATGIILAGYFVDISDSVSSHRYNRARAIMERRINEARKILGKSGISPDRYFLRIQPWITAGCDYGCEPQPKFPHLSIIEIRPDCSAEKPMIPNMEMNQTRIERRYISHS